MDSDCDSDSDSGVGWAWLLILSLILFLITAFAENFVRGDPLKLRIVFYVSVIGSPRGIFSANITSTKIRFHVW